MLSYLGKIYVKSIYIMDSQSWECPACTLMNAPENQYCEVCETRRPGLNLGPYAAQVAWTCQDCTFENQGGNWCQICDAPRPGSTGQRLSNLFNSGSGSNPFMSLLMGMQPLPLSPPLQQPLQPSPVQASLANLLGLGPGIGFGQGLGSLGSAGQGGGLFQGLFGQGLGGLGGLNQEYNVRQELFNLFPEELELDEFDPDDDDADEETAYLYDACTVAYPNFPQICNCSSCVIGAQLRIAMYERNAEEGDQVLDILKNTILPILSDAMGGLVLTLPENMGALGGSLHNFINQTLYDEHAPKPASKDALEKIPVLTIEDEEMSKENCPTCLAPFQMGDEYVQLPCKHVFHPDCFFPWMKENHTCPVCRKSIEDNEETT